MTQNFFTPNDHLWMTRALRLAEKGLNSTSPNPRVGCVLVKHKQVIGEGWHERAGEAHAEVHALRAAGAQAQEATAYVTLEPCAHHGRTPPCALALIDAGVREVVVAMQDPNPLVAGRGMLYLAQAGIDVRCGLLENEAEELNLGFISRMQRQRPWVRIKLGISLDGRTALADGRSQWITGVPARFDVQALRARSCAILTGIGTVLADNPQLNVRDIPTDRQPLRVVLDSQLRTPPESRIVGPGTLIVTGSADLMRHKPFLARGAQIWQAPHDAEQRIDLHALMRELALRGINELHVEAGAGLSGALLSAQLADEIVLYVAPAFMGNDARGVFGLPAPSALEHMARWRWHDFRQVGDDLRITLRQPSS